jgi:hypothetical protein
MKRLVSHLFVAALLAAIFPHSSPAQINDPAVKPVNVARLESKRPLIEYTMAGAFIVAALAIGFKPSKRSADAE